MSEKRLRSCLSPVYLKDFACIAQDCNENCCRYWKISVDKPTYNKYMTVSADNPLASRLKKCIKRDRRKAPGVQYAKMQLNSNGYCQLMTTEGLCAIQLALGEDYLTDTCYLYPRLEYIVDGVLCRDLTLSCEAAAKLVLSIENGIEYYQYQIPYGNRFHATFELNTSTMENAFKLKKYFCELRNFSIEILQNRNYKIWQRLLILGMFMKNIQSKADENKLNEISDVMAKYAVYIAQKAFDEHFSSIKTDIPSQLKFVLDMPTYQLRNGQFSPAYLKTLNNFYKSLGIAQEETQNKIVLENYTNASEKYFVPFMDEHEYYLENFLVSFMFANAFPLNSDQPFDAYLHLVGIYALYKGMLIAKAAKNSGLDEDMVIETCTQVIRNIHQSFTTKTYILGSLRKDNLDSLAYATMLIKN